MVEPPQLRQYLKLLRSSTRTLTRLVDEQPNGFESTGKFILEVMGEKLWF